MDANAPRSVAGGCLILLVLALPLYLFGLGRTGLSDPDEPYYALTAKEMLQNGDYTVPLFHGHPWFDKPILFYWIVLAGYRLLGVSEAGAPLRAGLARGCGIVPGFVLGRAPLPSPPPAFGAAIVLGTPLQYLGLAPAPRAR